MSMILMPVVGLVLRSPAEHRQFDARRAASGGGYRDPAAREQRGSRLLPSLLTESCCFR